jgi:hypothetical protein
MFILGSVEAGALGVHARGHLGCGELLVGGSRVAAVPPISVDWEFCANNAGQLRTWASRDLLGVCRAAPVRLVFCGAVNWSSWRSRTLASALHRGQAPPHHKLPRIGDH